MSARLAGMAPQTAARLAGFLYLLIIAGGLFAEIFVRGLVFVPGDAAATASNVLQHELRYRLGFTVHLTYLACALPLALIFYDMLRCVNRTPALLALFFDLVAITVESVNLLNHLAALRLLGGVGMGAFSPEQLQALAYSSLRQFSSGFAMSLAFFGFFCLFVGYLIFKSGFLPRILGILMFVAGACYLINSYSNFVAPRFAAQLFPWILVPCFIAELSLALWLLVKGVNVRAWEQRVDLAAGRVA